MGSFFAKYLKMISLHLVFAIKKSFFNNYKAFKLCMFAFLHYLCINFD